MTPDTRERMMSALRHRGHVRLAFAADYARAIAEDKRENAEIRRETREIGA